MSAPSPFTPERRPVRLWLVPIASTVAASALAALPLVVSLPWVPPFGLLMALAWRLLRPEIWGAWMALPLGLADDLLGGAPLGSAAALWTIVFLGLDIADHRMMWRDIWDDWRIAAAAILFCDAGAWALAAFTGGAGPAWTVLPQTVLGALLFPVASGAAARLDRWRLRRDAIGEG